VCFETRAISGEYVDSGRVRGVSKTLARERPAGKAREEKGPYPILDKPGNLTKNEGGRGLLE